MARVPFAALFLILITTISMLSLARCKTLKRDEQENKADLGGSRDQKTPIQIAQSSKEKKKGQHWFPSQISRKMSQDYDSLEVEHYAAVAATAFAIRSQEISEQKMNEAPQTSLTKTKSKLDGSFKSTDGQGNKVPIYPVTDEKKPEKAVTSISSMKKASTFNDDTKPETPAPKRTPTFGDKNLKKTDDTKRETPAPKRTPTFDDKNLKKKDDTKPENPAPTRTPTFGDKTPAPKIDPPVQSGSSRPTPPPPPPIWDTSKKPGPVRPPTPPTNTKRQASTRPRANEAKADAWEREELEKIKLRYEKLKETIDSWENKKNAKARRKLEKQQHSESQRKRMKAAEKFRGRMQYINEIAEGARAQAEERRRKEELKVKEKANIIRTTGKVPGACSCF